MNGDERRSGLDEMTGPGLPEGEMPQRALRQFSISQALRLPGRGGEVLERDHRVAAMPDLGPPEEIVQRRAVAEIRRVRVEEHLLHLRARLRDLCTLVGDEEPGDLQHRGLIIVARSTDHRLRAPEQRTGHPMIAEHVARTRAHQQHLRVIGRASQHQHRCAFDLVGSRPHHQTEPMVKEGLGCGEELGRMEGVRDRCRRIRRLQRGSGAAVASSGAFGIDVQDLGASPGEGGMPAVHDPVRALEAVEEQSEAHAGLEQGRRVGATGHRGRERRGQLAADAPLRTKSATSGGSVASTCSRT